MEPRVMFFCMLARHLIYLFILSQSSISRLGNKTVQQEVRLSHAVVLPKPCDGALTSA